MKRFYKTIVNILAVMVLAVACMGLTACGEDIRKLELKISVYNFTDSEFTEETLTVELFRHLAPDTVDAVINYVKAGYYDDAFFYKTAGYTSQIMVGNYKYSKNSDNNDVISKNYIDGKLPPAIEGEFEMGGTTGSNLRNKEGSVGLWRTWTATDDKNGATYRTSTSVDTGRATWFLPTSDLSSSYDEWFCVFAQINLTTDDNKAAWDAIKAALAFSDENTYESYTIYYTGEYDAEKADEDYGLTFNCVATDDFDADELGAFEATGNQLVEYNACEIKVPFSDKTNKVNKAVAAKIVSVTVK